MRIVEETRALMQASSAQFFRGVATVCTKLFNAVEPDHAYFGQKDIQQALLLKLSKSSRCHACGG